MKKIAMTMFLMMSMSFVIAKHPGTWKMLSEKNVKFSVERDHFFVGAGQGTFSKIKIKVKKGGVNFLSVRVEFGNGDIQDVSIRQFIRSGGETRIIDLDGGRRRHIRRVNMVYKTSSRLKRGQAAVSLWAYR
jgi:hypothetical protein